MTPMVSIITPAYNSEDYLEACVMSVKDQTFTDWELLIVLDCKSKDQSFTISESLSKTDSRIKIVESPNCVSISTNRNTGLLNSTGTYICFLDSDDVWHPEKLATQLEFMTKKQINFSFHDFETFIERPGKRHVTSIRKAKSDLTFTDLLKDNSIGCSTVMIKRDLITKFSFPEARHEDYILWLKILRPGVKAYHLPKILCSYRLSEHSTSGNKIRSAVWRWNAYGFLNISFLPRVYYFIFYVFCSLKKRI